MHEYILVHSLAEKVNQRFESEKLEKSRFVLKVVLGFGIFSHEKFDIIEFWWEQVKKEFFYLKNSTIEAEEVPGVIFCNECRIEYTIYSLKSLTCDLDLHILSCPVCNSNDTVIKKGDEVFIKKVLIGDPKIHVISFA